MRALRLSAAHVSFATAEFTQAARMLRRSAGRHGLETHVFGPGDAVIADLGRRHPAIMAARRGAGFWLWKPAVILDAMTRVPDGTPVLYTDVALTFVADPAPLLALADESPVCLFGSGEPGGQAMWTKRDCFVELDADTTEYWDLPQLSAGIQLYRAGPEAREFLRDLSAAMANETALCDAPNVHGRPNLPDYVDHRHDQSILTILAHRHDVATRPDPSQFGNRTATSENRPYGQIVHLHRQRNHHPFTWARCQLRGVYTGGRGFA